MKNNISKLLYPAAVIFYFTTRLINLKIIPIFTDEAIYSYWTQIALHDPANRFISLEDGKQPLFIWIAAIIQKFINDPLIANRLVSVFAGFGSLGGIYLLSKELFDEKIARWCALLYIISPFTLLYNKLGIYDSLLTMLGIYAVYFSVRLAKKPALDMAFVNGFAIGLGLITKSSASFFLYLLPFSLLNFNFKDTKVAKRLFNWLKFSVVTFLLAELFYNSLRLSPLFYLIKRKNYEFIKPFSEILKNPFQPSFSNFKGLIGWLVTYTTWPLFVIFILGLILGISKKDKKVIYLSFLVLTPFFAEVVLNKVLYPRFMLFYFPYIILIIAYAFKTIGQMFKKYKKLITLGFLVLLILPFYTSFKLLTNPAYANIPQADSDQYFNDWPAGYGVSDIIKIIGDESRNKDVHVGTEGTFGLFPHSLNAYFFDDPKVHIHSYWPVNQEDLPVEILGFAKKTKTYFIFNFTQNEIANPHLKFVAKYRKGRGNSYMRLYEVTQ